MNASIARKRVTKWEGIRRFGKGGKEKYSCKEEIRLEREDIVERVGERLIMGFSKKGERKKGFGTNPPLEFDLEAFLNSALASLSKDFLRVKHLIYLDGTGPSLQRKKCLVTQMIDGIKELSRKTHSCNFSSTRYRSAGS